MDGRSEEEHRSYRQSSVSRMPHFQAKGLTPCGTRSSKGRIALHVAYATRLYSAWLSGLAFCPLCGTIQLAQRGQLAVRRPPWTRLS